MPRPAPATSCPCRGPRRQQDRDHRGQPLRAHPVRRLPQEHQRRLHRGGVKRLRPTSGAPLPGGRTKQADGVLAVQARQRDEPARDRALRRPSAHRTALPGRRRHLRPRRHADPPRHRSAARRPAPAARSDQGTATAASGNVSCEAMRRASLPGRLTRGIAGGLWCPPRLRGGRPEPTRAASRRRRRAAGARGDAGRGRGRAWARPSKTSSPRPSSPRRPVRPSTNACHGSARPGRWCARRHEAPPCRRGIARLVRSVPSSETMVPGPARGARPRRRARQADADLGAAGRALAPHALGVAARQASGPARAGSPWPRIASKTAARRAPCAVQTSSSALPRARSSGAVRSSVGSAGRRSSLASETPTPPRLASPRRAPRRRSQAAPRSRRARSAPIRPPAKRDLPTPRFPPQRTPAPAGRRQRAQGRRSRGPGRAPVAVGAPRAAGSRLGKSAAGPGTVPRLHEPDRDARLGGLLDHRQIRPANPATALRLA